MIAAVPRKRRIDDSLVAGLKRPHIDTNTQTRTHIHTSAHAHTRINAHSTSSGQRANSLRQDTSRIPASQPVPTKQLAQTLRVPTETPRQLMETRKREPETRRQPMETSQAKKVIVPGASQFGRSSGETRGNAAIPRGNTVTSRGYLGLPSGKPQGTAREKSRPVQPFIPGVPRTETRPAETRSMTMRAVAPTPRQVVPTPRPVNAAVRGPTATVRESTGAGPRGSVAPPLRRVVVPGLTSDSRAAPTPRPTAVPRAVSKGETAQSTGDTAQSTGDTVQRRGDTVQKLMTPGRPVTSSSATTTSRSIPFTRTPQASAFAFNRDLIMTARATETRAAPSRLNSLQQGGRPVAGGNPLKRPASVIVPGAARGNMEATRGTLGVARGNLGVARGNLGVNKGNLGGTRGNLGGARGNLGGTRGNLGAARGYAAGARGKELPQAKSAPVRMIGGVPQPKRAPMQGTLTLQRGISLQRGVPALRFGAPRLGPPPGRRPMQTDPFGLDDMTEEDRAFIDDGEDEDGKCVHAKMCVCVYAKVCVGV